MELHSTNNFHRFVLAVKYYKKAQRFSSAYIANYHIKKLIRDKKKGGGKESKMKNSDGSMKIPVFFSNFFSNIFFYNYYFSIQHCVFTGCLG